MTAPSSRWNGQIQDWSGWPGPMDYPCPAAPLPRQVASARGYNDIPSGFSTGAQVSDVNYLGRFRDNYDGRLSDVDFLPG